MSHTIPIHLDEHFSAFLNHLTQSGRYGSIDEAIQAALHLLEQEEAKVEALQNALSEGEESGESTQAFSDLVKEAQSEFYAS